MSTLLLFLHPRHRLRAQGQPASADGPGRGVPGSDADHYDYLLTADGRQITAQGRVAAAALPTATTVIAIPAEPDVAWQRVELPRAGRQMRAALAGLLEESLLDEAESLHFALEADAGGGDTAWVAVCSGPWLVQQLARLEAAQVFVDRVTPLAWPQAAGQPARGHFVETGNVASPVALRWSSTEGVLTLPLNGGLTRQLFPPELVESAQWTATPAVVEEAEAWLGAPVAIQAAEQRALGVIDSTWDLRQFELVQRTRGLRALRQLGSELMRPQWRAVRWGLAGLVLVQLLGINLLAWQQSRHLQSQRAALSSTLTSTYPQVRAVLDAPVQMRRETEALRSSAGRAGPQDLETLLAAAATAWPADRGPVDALSFEPGRLTVSASGWSAAQIEQFRSQLRSEGWRLDADQGRLTLSRATNT